MISVEVGFVLLKLLFASLRGRKSACKCLVMQHCRNIPLGGGREIYGWEGWKSKIDYCEAHRSVL